MVIRVGFRVVVPKVVVAIGIKLKPELFQGRNGWATEQDHVGYRRILACSHRDDPTRLTETHQPDRCFFLLQESTQGADRGIRVVSQQLEIGCIDVVRADRWPNIDAARLANAALVIGQYRDAFLGQTFGERHFSFYGIRAMNDDDRRCCFFRCQDRSGQRDALTFKFDIQDSEFRRLGKHHFR